jgi:hypothetical protein
LVLVGLSDVFFWRTVLPSASRLQEEERRILATIIPFLHEREVVFDPEDITAMSTALDEVCKALRLQKNSAAREVMAVRIIELAKAGERRPSRLRDRVLHEADPAAHISPDEDAATSVATGNAGRE